MILCVTPNPAVDRTLVVPGFRTGQIFRPREVISLPGGKGINVARALKTLGGRPLVTGCVRSSCANFMEGVLRDEGIESDFVRTAGEPRICTSIYDPQNGALTEIYENGAPLDPQDRQAWEGRLEHLFSRGKAAVFSGSLPPGLAAEKYASWILDARGKGLLCALDASGDALRTGLEIGRPHVIKPNREEFCRLTGLDESAGMPVFARAANAMAAENDVLVFLSLGSAGALLADGERVSICAPPPVQTVSAVGSGDAFLAGVVLALCEKESPLEALRRGVASGTANTLLLGAARLDPDQYRRILSDTHPTFME